MLKNEQEKIQWYQLSVPSVAESLNLDLKSGLAQSDIAARQKKYGLNVLTPAKRMNEFMRFLTQFQQPLVYILLLATAVTFYLGETVDSMVIFGVVFINAVVGYMQEAKAEKAIDALSNMVVTTALVKRGGHKIKLPSAQLVPGDIVILQSGDKVPADVRLYHAKSLQIDESALTGESVPVDKNVDAIRSTEMLADQRNMAFAGTLVTHGQGEGIVCSTGDQTEIGRIATLTSQAADLSTPLTIKIAQFSHILLIAILILAVITFFVGVLRGNSYSEMFMAAVALAVGAIPEGLPAAVTITLAIGVSRMAKRKAIIRKLPAVEALGSATVICSDKTGTLTENQMTVRRIYAGRGMYDVTGNGYEANGEILKGKSPVIGGQEQALRACLLGGILCNDTQAIKEEQRFNINGDPTEGALIIAAHKVGMDDKAIAAANPRLDAIPFESEHQYMATLHLVDQSKYVIYVKGAAETIIEKCSNELTDDGLHVAFDANNARAAVDNMTSQGLRVLAIAMIQSHQSKSSINHQDIQNGLVFLGLQGMIDPPRPEAIQAIKKCQTAGVMVKMITGDHMLTAKAIAQRIGLIAPADQRESLVLTGQMLNRISDEDLVSKAQESVVFARVVPEQKLRLVKALQAGGHVVAMTGDGVNDAPALKQSDIGIAMGITGTDVAKSSADMLLTDDNFASIEAAVEEGRGVFDNLTKFIIWTLPTNMGEAMILLTAIFMGTALPALPVQLLWVNMTTAIFLGLMLVFEPKEDDLMRRNPRDPKTPILTFELLMRTGLVTAVMLVGGFWLFLHVQKNHGLDMAEARTVVINAIVVVEIFYLFNCRVLNKPLLMAKLKQNNWIYIGITMMIGAQLLFTYSPLMNKLFHTAPITLEYWFYIVLVGLFAFLIVELEKWLRAKFGK